MMAEDLVHEYDPVKRHEYYLKMRKLKGHQPAAKKVSGVHPRAKAPVKPVKTRAQRQAERTRKLEAQVNALKTRMEKLRTVLAELTKQAKARSGVDVSKTTSKKAASPQKKSPAEHKTASQKAKAAKQSKEYYEKHKDEILADEIKSLNGKIKTIQERIAKMRKNGSIGAPKTAK